jgi:hypothetical protein
LGEPHDQAEQSFITNGSGLFFTGHALTYENHDGPETSENYICTMPGQKPVAFGSGFSKRGFRKDNLIYTFGRTEDVPLVIIWRLTAGWNRDNTIPEPIMPVHPWVSYLSQSGYLYGQVRFGTLLTRCSGAGCSAVATPVFFATLSFQPFPVP